MSAAENKKLMERIYTGTANRDGSLLIESLADDVNWTVTGRHSWSQTFRGKAAVLNGLLGNVRSFFAERPRTVPHRFIADGDYVAVEAHGDNVTKAGLRYDNEYCMVYRLEGGKIKEVREYCDSALIEKVLGPFPESKKPAVS
jgi:uncharacterized protein